MDSFFSIVQVNLKKTCKRYHWNAKQGFRDSKYDRLSCVFKFEEECNRNVAAETIGQMANGQMDLGEST